MLRFDEIGKYSFLFGGEELTDQETYYLLGKLAEFRNGAVSEEEKKKYNEMIWEREKFKMEHFGIRFKVVNSRIEQPQGFVKPRYKMDIEFYNKDGDKIDSNEFYLYHSPSSRNICGYQLELVYRYDPSIEADNLTAEMLLMDERYRLKILNGAELI